MLKLMTTMTMTRVTSSSSSMIIKIGRRDYIALFCFCRENEILRGKNKSGKTKAGEKCDIFEREKERRKKENEKKFGFVSP